MSCADRGLVWSVWIVTTDFLVLDTNTILIYSDVAREVGEVSRNC